MLSRTALANVHRLAGQRFYNLLCIAYGKEPRLFADLVEKKYLLESRAGDCADECGHVAYAVKTLMGMSRGASSAGRAPAIRHCRSPASHEGVSPCCTAGRLPSQRPLLR